MTVQDPFENPTPRQSKFASPDSLRGRLVIIEPTKVEHDVPKSNASDAARGDKVTATVTLVDGQGPIQTFSNYRPTGVWLDGDVHRGVWFSQDQLAAGLLQLDGKTLKKMVLCRIDTLKPGQGQGKGNPWVMNDPSEDDKQTARNYLANRTVSAASAPSQPAAQAAPKNPFG